METYQQEFCPAHIDPADQPEKPSRWLPALLPGAVGVAIAGLVPGTAAGVVGLGWVAPTEPLTVGAMALALALGLAGTVWVRHLVGVPAGGRRVRVDDRAWGHTRRTPRPPGPQPAGPQQGSGPPPSGHPELTRPDPEPGSGTGAAPVDRAAAEEFLREFHAEHPEAGPVEPRIAAVMGEIDHSGSYWHTPQELAFGARAAWRNNSRCIGRLYWRSLQVRDLRTVSHAAGVARHCFEHLGAANNGGKIRPMISVFAPETPSRRAPRIWNEQLIRYAGYEQPDGRVLGDPRYREFTSEMIRRGWRPPETRGAFDVLPLVVETPDEGPRMFQLPGGSVHEVRFEHPELAWFADLGMRWHAVPVISNNVLVIGGVSYPAAPFNGWYMGTEIGARNLADSERYDMVPVVAERMGLDTSDDATLWRDRALVEINRAVLHSFRVNGVAITDHHTESRRFLTHLEKEERAGRGCPADWTWIVPPMSGSQTPVFHRYYDNEERLPNFFSDAEAARRALQGGPPAFR